VKARTLRIYPNITVGVSSSSVIEELSAVAVVKRCVSELGLLTEEARCNDLKCRSYCYRSLDCEGMWVDYCEQEREKGQLCDVDCSYATKIGGLHRHVGSMLGAALILGHVLLAPLNS